MYALAGRIDIDFEKEPVGKDKNGKDVFFKDLWPSKTEIKKVSSINVTSEMFKEVYGRISKGSDRWNQLNVSPSLQYGWKQESTYIHNPPFFQNTTRDLPTMKKI